MRNFSLQGRESAVVLQALFHLPGKAPGLLVRQTGIQQQYKTVFRANRSYMLR